MNNSIQVRNTGREVNLSLECVSSDGSCSFVSLSDTEWVLSENSSEQVEVFADVPSDAESGDVMRYGVHVIYPEGNRAEVNFFVTINLVYGSLLNYLGKLVMPVQVGLSFAAALFAWLATAFANTRLTWNEGYMSVELLVPIIVFLVALALV